MDILRLLARAATILLLFWAHALVCTGRLVSLWVRRAPREERQALLSLALVDLLRDLGATYIKIGQYLSTRPDLVPAPLHTALQALQDRVGPFPYAKVRAILAAELGQPPEQLFAELDPYPVASASIAQVHRATLPGGRLVAVKVLRPRIERVVGFDLRVMRLCVRLLRLLPPLRPFSLEQMLDEFAQAVQLQLDLRQEATNNRIFARNFAREPDIAVPELLEELCTRRVLTMSFVTGDRILGPQVRWEPAQREAIARLGFRLILSMVFRHGFVHADLHPGNLLWSEGRLVMLDLGLVAPIDQTQRQILLGLFSAWASQNAPEVANRLCQLLPPGQELANRELFQQQVAQLVGRYAQARLGEVGMGEILVELVRLIRRQQVQLQASLTMVLLAIAVVEGVGRQLVPELDLVSEALRFFQQEASRSLSSLPLFGSA